MMNSHHSSSSGHVGCAGTAHSRVPGLPLAGCYPGSDVLCWKEAELAGMRAALADDTVSAGLLGLRSAQTKGLVGGAEWS